MSQQPPFLVRLLKALFNLLLIAAAAVGIWLVGQHFQWHWGDFMFDAISSGISGLVIGLIVYWGITRPHETRSAQNRRKLALAMLKVEFMTDLERARKYREALKTPANDLGPLYPLHFTRGAWNALKESGFLPQIEDVGLVVELLHVNEIIVIANDSLATVIQAHVERHSEKLARYAYQARMECTQIEDLLVTIIAKFDRMNLPKPPTP
jgi:hypothetical protein